MRSGKIRRLVLAGVVFIAVIVGCGAPSSAATGSNQAPPAPQSPRDGWVTIFEGERPGHHIQKRCDGTTLVYRRESRDGGIAVIADSSECPR